MEVYIVMVTRYDCSEENSWVYSVCENFETANHMLWDAVEEYSIKYDEQQFCDEDEYFDGCNIDEVLGDIGNVWIEQHEILKEYDPRNSARFNREAV